MADVTQNYRRARNTAEPLRVFEGLAAGGAGHEFFEGAWVGKNVLGYYENANNTKHLVEMATVGKYADNRNGANGDVKLQLEQGVFVSAFTGTVDRRHVGAQAVIDADNQTGKRWDPASLPTAVAVGDANSMSLQGLRPGVAYRVINEGANKALDFREDRPGELTISIKTDGGGASHADNTGTIITAALNAHPLARSMARAAVLGTGNTVLIVAAGPVVLSAPKLGEIVRVTDTDIYVNTL